MRPITDQDREIEREMDEFEDGLEEFEAREAYAQEQEKRPPAFRNKRTGRFQQCRLVKLHESLENEAEQAMMDYSGCQGEFENDFRKRDLADGCPHCTESVIENASEPDVMARWDLRRR